ncbi:MAG: metal ABC transporter substrate-binding protein [Clostridia bacterium]
MKRIVSVILVSLFILSCAIGCAARPAPDGVTIVATLFPQYDFARAIAGDRATVTLLLPPGVESHSYEPTPRDVINISSATLFVYTGEYMEPWAKQLSAQAKNVVDASSGLILDAEHQHADDDAEHDEHSHGGYDPHIWTDPTMAAVMVDNIAVALMACDKANADYYRANADTYIEKLYKLDEDISTAVSEFTNRTVCFGGRFAMHYFAKRYELTPLAAYDSCSSETEPSAKAVAQIIDAVRSQHIKAIYYEELVDPKVARSIAAEAGCEPLLLHSCHNLSREEFDAGETYLSLMYKNLENLKKGLG